MLGVKKLGFWQKYFPSINFMGLHHLSSKLWPGKWNLHEGYGVSNFGEERVSIVSTFIV